MIQQLTVLAFLSLSTKSQRMLIQTLGHHILQTACAHIFKFCLAPHNAH